MDAVAMREEALTGYSSNNPTCLTCSPCICARSLVAYTFVCSRCNNVVTCSGNSRYRTRAFWQASWLVVRPELVYVGEFDRANKREHLIEFFLEGCA